MRGTRGQYPGTFRSSKNRWSMKGGIDGELHFLGALEDHAAAAAYARLVESRHSGRLSRRGRGTLYRRRGRWLAFWAKVGGRPERAPIGGFGTRWEGARHAAPGVAPLKACRSRRTLARSRSELVVKI
jgi:hypothetical protein